MTSMELQARKMSIIEELLQLNTMEALDKVAKVVRAMRKEEKVKSPCMYTVEEVSCLLNQIESDFEAGNFVAEDSMNDFIDQLK